MFNSRLLGKGSQSAVAMLETTIVLPLLLTMLTALVFLGIKLQARALITNITQEGARLIARDSSVGCESSYLENLEDSNLDPVYIASNLCPIPSSLTVSASHRGIYKLLNAINTRDKKFNITNIKLTTRYCDSARSLNNCGSTAPVANDDNVYVSISADIEVDTILSGSLLSTAGLLSYTVNATSSQPYLLSSITP